MTTYYAIAGQSIYDVCLQTYGALDYLFKLLQDNGINGLNEPVNSRQPFQWDETLVQDQQLNTSFLANGVRYATDISGNGSVFYVTNTTGGGGGINPPPDPYQPPTNPSKTYQMVFNTYFTSGTDGTTVVTLTDVDGNLLTGFDIVQIEKEIKPLKPSQYVWNKNLAQLTLIDGTTVDNGETLFVLYSKIVTE